MPEGPGTAVACWSGSSVRGLLRKHNADAWAVGEGGRYLTFAVADGVSSLPASARASAAAVAAVRQWGLSLAATPRDGLGGLFSAVDAAVARALAPGMRAGATTLACALIWDGRCTVAAIGDSEALAVHESGPAERLHELDQAPGRPNVLLAWIDGAAPLSPHVAELRQPPSRLCLVTDGITRVVGYARIAEIVRAEPIGRAAAALTGEACRLGTTDDATALVVARGGAGHA